MSNFPFVKKVALRNNIDQVFSHIIDLLALSESETYENDRTRIFVSNLRKTIIIHTASIIEALLRWKLIEQIEGKTIELSDDWIYKNVKILYESKEDGQVVGAIRNKVKKNAEQLDFIRIIDVALKHKIITKKIWENLHTVRKYRNRLHIDDSPETEGGYTKKRSKILL